MPCAFKLFAEIPQRNMLTWNAMILGCNKNSMYEYSWKFFCLVHNVGAVMDEFTYSGVISACGCLGNATGGLQVFGLVWKNGFFSSGFVRAGMVDLFAKCGRVEDSLRVLYDYNCEDVVCWSAVMSGAVKNQSYWVALDVFSQMCRYGSLSPTYFTFSSVLSACAAVGELDLGKCIHGRIIKSGDGDDVCVGTAIVDMYAESGAMVDALKQFKLMTMRNVVSWTVIVSGFVNQGDIASAFSALNEMKRNGEEIRKSTFSCVLSGCGNLDMFEEALQIHCWTFKAGIYQDPAVKASLIRTYSKVGAVNLSEQVFIDTQDLKQVGLWANMISAFVKSGNYEKAVFLFQKMLEMGITPDMYIVSSILSMEYNLNLGRQVHGYTLKLGLLSEHCVSILLFTMYSRFGNVEDSLKAFEKLERKDNISSISMIIACAANGYPDKAIQLFREMGIRESLPDERLLAVVLNSCTALHSLKLGREIHGHALQRRFGEQFIIDSALIRMYSKCGDLSSARIVFDRMPIKDDKTWCSLISGVSRSGNFEEALHLFRSFLLSDATADACTISSTFGALTYSIKLDIGPQLHAYAIKMGIEAEPSVGSSLIMMYSKSGSIDECDKVFRQIINPDLVCWTTMIASYGNNGKGSEALQLFDHMKKSGITPDAVTFVGVLSACSNSGLVDEGYFHLSSMIRDYKIKPNQKHYACMVNLLGRAGRLEEAKTFIDSMHLKPSILVWETFIASCKEYGNHELGKVAAEKVMELQPSDVGSYVSVSNMYAEAGLWDHVMKIREAVWETGVGRKEVGLSYA